MRLICVSARLDAESAGRSFPLLSSPRKSVRSPLEQISRFALQCITKLIQDIGAVGFAAPVKKSVQSRICDFGLLLEFVSRPALAFEDLFQFANNHGCTLEVKSGVLDIYTILYI
jgi:hypothetical protein